MSVLHYFPTLAALSLEIARLDEMEGGFPAEETGRSAIRLDEGRDCTRVQWPGLAGSFWFDRKQARVVGALVDAMLTSESVEMSQDVLLREAGARGVRRLADLFTGNTAWGRLILPGFSPGYYRLAPLPPDGDDAA